MKIFFLSFAFFTFTFLQASEERPTLEINKNIAQTFVIAAGEKTFNYLKKRNTLDFTRWEFIDTKPCQLCEGDYIASQRLFIHFAQVVLGMADSGSHGTSKDHIVNDLFWLQNKTNVEAITLEQILFKQIQEAENRGCCTLQ